VRGSANEHDKWSLLLSGIETATVGTMIGNTAAGRKTVHDKAPSRSLSPVYRKQRLEV
jgi:hypothetical protein